MALLFAVILACLIGLCAIFSATRSYESNTNVIVQSGAFFVVCILFFIIFRCIRAARNAQSRYGYYAALGVAAMLIFHTFENVGMCIGLMPVTGIPLPFISYGGTSLLTNLIAVGIVLNISRQKKRYVPQGGLL